MAAVGDRAEDLVLKEFLRAGTVQGDGGKAINDFHASAGLAPLCESKAVDGKPPPQPRLACDHCGASSAKQRCSQCASAHYCGRDCQTAAWRAGHKAECATLKQACERDGKKVVRALSSDAKGPSRIEHLGKLDREGAYAVAVGCGLFAGLTKAMRDDALDVQFAWIEGRCCSYLHHITTTVFRGERHRTDGGFGSVDADRVSSFLAAEPDGWHALVGNAKNVAAMALRCRIERDLWPVAHRTARDVWTFFNLALTHRAVAVALLRVPPDCAAAADAVGTGAPSAARPTAPTADGADLDMLLDDAMRLGAYTEAQIDAWTDALADNLESEHSLMLELAPYAPLPRVPSRGVWPAHRSSCRPASVSACPSIPTTARLRFRRHVADAAAADGDTAARRNASACIAVATTVRIFKGTMGICWEADPARDPGSTVEANVFQAAAMLGHWTRELAVGVDVEKVRRSLANAFSRLLPPSPAFSRLLPPSPTFSHLLPPSPLASTPSRCCSSTRASARCSATSRSRWRSRRSTREAPSRRPRPWRCCRQPAAAARGAGAGTAGRDVGADRWESRAGTGFPLGCMAEQDGRRRVHGTMAEQHELGPGGAECRWCWLLLI